MLRYFLPHNFVGMTRRSPATNSHLCHPCSSPDRL